MRRCRLNLLTRHEVAARLRVCVRTIDKRIADGRAPDLTRIGRRVLISEAALVRYIEANTAPSRGRRETSRQQQEQTSATQ